MKRYGKKNLLQLILLTQICHIRTSFLLVEYLDDAENTFQFSYQFGRAQFCELMTLDVKVKLS
jgi:hypothetical protein